MAFYCEALGVAQPGITKCKIYQQLSRKRITVYDKRIMLSFLVDKTTLADFRDDKSGIILVR
jgi:hypothetical protein